MFGLSGVEADKVARRLKTIAPLAALDNATRNLTRTAATGPVQTGGQCFEDIPWGQCRLIGFNVTTSSAITSLQPIYAVAGDSLATKIYGKASDTSARIVAKPGYTIGGIVAESGDRVMGMQIVFMRVREGRLDPTDSYCSDWLGGRSGQGEVRLGCDGKLVVGVYGECGDGLQRLGLVQAE
jgi:hypothetical protein